MALSGSAQGKAWAICSKIRRTFGGHSEKLPLLWKERAAYGFLEEGLLSDSLCLPYSEKCSDFFLRRHMQDHSIASDAYVSV